MGHEGRPANGAAAAGGIISMETMQRHLDGIYIGYRPGDPTASTPPAAMPPPATESVADSRVIDLRQLSMAELMAEAATTHSRDFFAALLPNPPGVPPERLAYVTGHAPELGEEEQPQKPQEQHQQQHQLLQQGQMAAQPAPPSSQATSTFQKLTDESIAAVLARHLGNFGVNGSGVRGGHQPPIPWAELGLGSGGPRMGGVECDLRLLWRLAYVEGGGFEAVGAANQWAGVARDMGADPRRTPNAAFLVRTWYQRFLLPYERLLRQQQRQRQQQQQHNGGGGNGGGKRKAAGEAEDSGPAMAPAAGAAAEGAASARQN